MSEQETVRRGYSRREFLGTCAAGGTAACVLVGLTVRPLEAAETDAGGSYRYKPVPDWPKLPEGLKMIGANGIALDSHGRVYVAGGDENAILVFARNGKFLRAWGKGIIQAKHQVRIFNDRVYVADTDKHQVYEFTLDGKLLRAFGTAGKAGLGENEFNMPTDIAFAANGDIYITDGYGNSRVVCLKPDGSFRRAWGSPGKEPGQFKEPHNIVVDAKGRVYVADRGNDRIQVFTPEGRFLKQWSNVGKPYGLFLTPDQILFVTDGNPDGPQRILVLDLDGKILATIGESGRQPGQFDVPHSIHVDEEGNIYVAEVENKRIQKLVPCR